jgi:hypothetical protein
MGFLAAGHIPSLGYLGGYLITTTRGRPVEFHYTQPVQPSTTHRILYGTELEPYIYGELIGACLVQQSAIEPLFLVTDQPLFLNRREYLSCPVVCVVKAPSVSGCQTHDAHVQAGSAAVDDPSTVAADSPESGHGRFPADGGGSSALLTHPGFPQDKDALVGWLDRTQPRLDLSEPFLRIWQALGEVVTGAVKQAAA